MEHDAKSADFWYVPKGQKIAPENWPRIAAHLKILKKYEDVPWEDAQKKYAQDLQDAKLIDPYTKDKKAFDFSAVARMQIPIWHLLGFAWLNDGVPELTEVGRTFVRAKRDRRRIITTQLLRYQAFNPCLAQHFNPSRTFPVLAFMRLLSQVEWSLDSTEFQLFASRVRSFDDADFLADRVREWRSISDGERDQLFAAANTLSSLSHTKSESGTTLNKVRNAFAYHLAILEALPYFELSSDRIAVRKSEIGTVQSLILSAAKTAEFIDYRTEKDWLAVYGQNTDSARSNTPWTTARDAREYYERIGRIDAAADAFAKDEKNVSAKAVEKYRSVQIFERVLEDILEQNLEHIEQGLVLVGRQFGTAVGPIDILAKDKHGVHVVIELKRGRSSDRVVGQIARYMAWIEDRLERGRTTRVRG
jgi:RecB family endonuclease NucS